MIIYEKNKNLNIDFGGKVTDNPQVILCESQDGVVSLLINGKQITIPEYDESMSGKVLSINSDGTGLEWVDSSVGELDTEVTEGSTNAVQNGAIYSYTSNLLEDCSFDVDSKVMSFTSKSGNVIEVDISSITDGLQKELNNDNKLSCDFIDGLATVSVSGSYNDLSDLPDIPVVPTKLSEFENDSKFITKDSLEEHTNNSDVHVTADEKSNWDAKSDFSGSYNDLTDKPELPSVPTKLSELENDCNFITEEYHDETK